MRSSFVSATRLANAVQIKNFAKEDKIVEQGGRGDSLIVVVEGDVEVRVDGEHRVTLVENKTNPVLIGESVFFTDGALRTATIIADSEQVIVLELTISALHSLFDEQPVPPRSLSL